ncbi:MAG: hypothetical protein EP298_01980 [Gammaproteobacteria bacterium]|nr:MAG: hypothetical protein EP298_01980 [Gammaproteobacteria bacterium]UTW42442.1 fibronectin type III domain-containing protein [bacterium SCSIO 12844]
MNDKQTLEFSCNNGAFFSVNRPTAPELFGGIWLKNTHKEIGKALSAIQSVGMLPAGNNIVYSEANMKNLIHKYYTDVSKNIIGTTKSYANLYTEAVANPDPKTGIGRYFNNYVYSYSDYLGVSNYVNPPFGTPIKITLAKMSPGKQVLPIMTKISWIKQAPTVNMTFGKRSKQFNINQLAKVVNGQNNESINYSCKVANEPNAACNATILKDQSILQVNFSNLVANKDTSYTVTATAKDYNELLRDTIQGSITYQSNPNSIQWGSHPIKVSDITKTTAKITWLAVSQPIDGVNYKYTITGKGVDQNPLTSPVPMFIKQTKLLPDTTYTVTVAASDQNDTIKRSQTFTTPGGSNNKNVSFHFMVPSEEGLISVVVNGVKYHISSSEDSNIHSTYKLPINTAFKLKNKNQLPCKIKLLGNSKSGFKVDYISGNAVCKSINYTNEQSWNPKKRVVEHIPTLQIPANL